MRWAYLCLVMKTEHNLQNVHCGSMRVSTKDMASTNTLWIHTSMSKGKNATMNNAQWSYIMRKRIATNQYKVDLCDSKSTSMMTILESIKYSTNPYRILGM